MLYSHKKLKEKQFAKVQECILNLKALYSVFTTECTNVDVYSEEY